MDPAKFFEELPPYREAMARGDWDRALALLKARAGAGGETRSPQEALHLASLHGLRGEIEEAVSLLKALEASTDPLIAAEAVLQLAGLRLLTQTASLQEIEGLIERASARAGPEKRLRGRVAHLRGRLHWKRSEIRQAGASLEEARQLLEETGDEEELAKVLDSLAMYQELCGEREKALASYCLSIAKKALWRDLYGIGITLGNLGRFHLKLNEPGTALSCFLDDLQIASRMGDLHAQVVLKINIGQALTVIGRLREAKKEIEGALGLSRQQGFRQEEVYALKDLARVASLQGDRAGARGLLDAALDLTPPESSGYPRGQILLARGELLLEDRDHEGARAAFDEARRCFAALGARQEEAAAIHGLAQVSQELKEWNSCLFYLDQGLGRLGGLGVSLATRFEETFAKLEIASRDRSIPRTVGPYRIVERIGGGAFAEVYRAFDEREKASRVNVAIKVLRLDGARDGPEREEWLQRFRRECEILTHVSHPNVVRLLDSGLDPRPYLVQEYVDGGDLDQLLKNGGPLPLERACSIMRQILSGLVALHEERIVHRDLKPANVLLRKNGAAVIADFGIARMLALTALTLQSKVMGTLAYMAPEQLRAQQVDHQADIYSAGVIFFELLTGRLPYEENTLSGILRRIELNQRPDLAQLLPDLPPVVARCVRRCLSEEKNQRYLSAGDVLSELEALHGSEGPH